MKKILLILPIITMFSCSQNISRPELKPEPDPDPQSVTRVDGDMSEAAADFIEYCKSEPCRQNTHFKVKLQDGSYYEYNGKLDPPVVQSGLVTLYPGESIYIEADVVGDTLVNLNLVREISNPDKTITIKFWQDTSMSSGTDMMLSVHNPFERFLRYELGMMTFDSNEVQYTSSCPVLPGKFAYEHWPFPLFQLAMTGFRLIDVEDGQISCE